jgi:hypothetical protein
MNKKINVRINNDSKITLETEGFKGEVCVSEIKKILSGFVEISDFELKSDYYDNDEELSVLEDITL